MNSFRVSLLAVALACVPCLGFANVPSVDSVSGVVTKFDEAPRALKTKPPRYPETLRTQGVSGAVVLALVIDEQGKVMAADVRRASHDAFREPALAAVQGWTFTPAKVGGQPVRALVQIPLNFNVEG
jgi:protein TonB